MNKIAILTLCFVLLSTACFAEDIYIAQASAGANSGANCSNARSVSWFNTSGNWANPKQSGQLGPGDTAHLCGTLTTPLTTQASGNSRSPITILFESGAMFSASTWSTGTGAITINKNYITLDGGTNGIIQATRNGTTAAFGGTNINNNSIYGVYIMGASYITVQNLSIKTIYNRLANSTDCMTGSRGIQVDGNSNNLTINKNSVGDAEKGVQVILSNTSNITVSNNIVSNSGLGVNVAPGNTSSTGTNINIFGNIVTGGSGWDGTFDLNCQINGCNSSCLTDTHVHQDGIYVFSQGATGWVNGVNIYSNYLQDFGTHSTAHIFISDIGVESAIIYNNVLVNTGLNYAANGMITIDATPSVRIYNNTLVGNYPTQNNNGIYLNSMNSTEPQNVDIKNNIILSVSTYIGWATGSTFTSGYNNFFNGSASPFYDSSNVFHTFLWWVGQTFAVNETSVNPQLNSSYKFTSSSPGILITNGANLSGIFKVDYAGGSRPPSGGWSVGAYQWSAPSPPALH